MSESMKSYNDKLTAEEQVDAEEELAAYLYDTGGLAEEEAQDLSREALRIVLERFRPDLFEASTYKVVKTVTVHKTYEVTVTAKDAYEALEVVRDCDDWTYTGESDEQDIDYIALDDA